MFSSNDPRTHFGLGDVELVNVTVRWPSGQVDEHSGIRTNRLVKVYEGGEIGVTDLLPIETSAARPEIRQPTQSNDYAIEDLDILSLRQRFPSVTADSETLIKYGQTAVAVFDEAIEDTLRVCLEAEPRNPLVFQEYAAYLHFRRRFDSSIDAISNAVELRPADWKLISTLAAYQARAGELEGAVENSRRAIAAGDGSTSTRLQLGNALIELQEFTEAEEVLLTVVGSDANSVESRISLAQVYADSGRLEQALILYREALNRDPGSREIRYRLADVLRRIGDTMGYEDQMRLFEMLDADSPMFKGGMPREQEIALLHREIRINPMFGRTRADRELALRYGELGLDTERQLYSTRGRLGTVKDELESVLNFLPRLLVVSSSEAVEPAFRELNGFRLELVEAFNRVGNYEPMKSDRLMESGYEAENQGRRSAALEAYRLALVSNPDNGAAYRALANLYHTNGLGTALARAFADKAVLLDQECGKL